LLFQAREAAKSGLVLFHEAMGNFLSGEVLEQTELFARAAAKGHAESFWIMSCIEGVELEVSALKEAFARSEEPLGWNLAGELSDGREAFELFKRSAEAGCSWGQARYALCFSFGDFVELSEATYVEWLEKAANQKNPLAMEWLGEWFFQKGSDPEKALAYFCAAADLGWKHSMDRLGWKLWNGEDGVLDLRQAVIWSAKGSSSESYAFWETMLSVEGKFGLLENRNRDFDQLCYALGWGLYWYQYEDTEDWKNSFEHSKLMVLDRLLDYYCTCVEMQQKSIVMFLLCWNQCVGVKDVGVMIGKMVWETREKEVLLKSF
jgi:TPR repeat protein